MDTPELVVWVVATKRTTYGYYNDEPYFEFEVEEKAYPTKEYALKRAKHVENSDGQIDAEVWPVKIHQEPMPQPAPVYVYPRLPPSMVYTKEDPSIKMQVAYDAPRRVLDPSLADAVCGTWAAWAQRAPGVQPSDVPEPASIAALFEESPSGTMQLFPRELPAPVH